MRKKKVNKPYFKNEYIIYDKPNEKQRYPHFRKYLKSGHPAMITGEYSVDEWSFHKVMHGQKDGWRNNDMITPNPNPLDHEPMYVGRRKRHDYKNNFSKWRYNWKMKNKKK